VVTQLCQEFPVGSTDCFAVKRSHCCLPTR
jgi:hypothetical protein